MLYISVGKGATPVDGIAVQAEHSLELHMPFIVHVFRRVIVLGSMEKDMCIEVVLSDAPARSMHHDLPGLCSSQVAASHAGAHHGGGAHARQVRKDGGCLAQP